MRKKTKVLIFCGVIVVLISLAVFIVTFANETPLDFSDDFQTNNFNDRWETVLIPGKTAGTVTNATRVVETANSENYALKPPANTTAGGYVVTPKDSVWPGGKPTNFKFNVTGSPSNTNPGFYVYYDKTTGARAGFTLTTANRTIGEQTKPVLILTWQGGFDGSNINPYGVSGVVSGSVLNSSYLKSTKNQI